MTPWVRLSPNARKRVNLRAGTGRTVIEKLHELARERLSVAVHVTFVVPTANVLPDAAVQVRVTGATPPWNVAAPKLTDTGPSSGDWVVTGDGHAMTGPVGSGAVGGLPHAASPSVAVNASRARPDLLVKHRRFITPCRRL